MEEISQIRAMRNKLGITQNELAKRARVSQSLVAKIESGKIDPSYSNVRKLFDTLSVMQHGKELVAKDILYTKIITVGKSETLKNAIAIMKKKNISQMPVMQYNHVVGYISESVVLNKLINGGSSSVKVGDIMESAPPIMPMDTSQEVLAQLLKHYPLVLIENKGNLVGIVTKVDLLKSLYKG